MPKNKGNKNKIKDSKTKATEFVPFEEKISKSIGSVMSLYIHTAVFTLSFLLIILGFSTEIVLLTLTTLVSLEAIYLSILIQIAVNKNTESLEEVEEDLDEIQEDLDEIADDVEDIQEDIDEIEEEVDDIEDSDNKRDNEVNVKFKNIDEQLSLILQEIKNLKK
jgi:peptidoglycan hydrolase CwlO-like protein